MKKFSKLVLMFAFVLLLVGCGNEKNNNDTPKDKDKLVATLKANNNDFTVIADVYTVDVDKTEDALPIIDLVRDNIESFEVIKGTMDDAFIGITGKEIRKWKV